MSPGSSVTLPPSMRKKRNKVPCQPLPNPNPVIPTIAVPPPTVLRPPRRCASVEVLFDESPGEGEEEEEGQEAGEGAWWRGRSSSSDFSSLAQSLPLGGYSRSVSYTFQSLNLMTHMPTPTTPTSLSFSLTHMTADYQSPQGTPNHIRRGLPSLPEEHISRRSSRRPSTSSVITFGHTPLEEQDIGIEVVGVGSEVDGRPGSEFRLAHLQSTESTFSFVYMQNHYSSTQDSGGGAGDTTTSTHDSPDKNLEPEPEMPRARRRSSAAMAVAIAAHLIPLGLYYFSQ